MFFTDQSMETGLAKQHQCGMIQFVIHRDSKINVPLEKKTGRLPGNFRENLPAGGRHPPL